MSERKSPADTWALCLQCGHAATLANWRSQTTCPRCGKDKTIAQVNGAPAFARSQR